MVWPRTRTLAAVAMGAVLFGLHLDVWRGPRPGLWWGWLPEEIGLRLIWMALTTAYLWWLTTPSNAEASR